MLSLYHYMYITQFSTVGILKGYSSGQSHFSEINVKLAEKNEFATRSVQKYLEMRKNEKKLSVSEDFRHKSSTSEVENSTSDVVFGKKLLPV